MQPNDILQQAVAELGGDISSSVRFSPLGDLVIRSLYAVNKVAPSTKDELSNIPGAFRVASMGLMPKVVGAGGLAGGALQVAQNALEGQNIGKDIIPSTIQGARNAATFAPLIPIANAINSPTLRYIPRDGGLSQYKKQTLIENILERLK